jgi:hypothetical protein
VYVGSDDMCSRVVGLTCLRIAALGRGIVSCGLACYFIRPYHSLTIQTDMANIRYIQLIFLYYAKMQKGLLHEHWIILAPTASVLQSVFCPQN